MSGDHIREDPDYMDETASCKDWGEYVTSEERFWILDQEFSREQAEELYHELGDRLGMNKQTTISISIPEIDLKVLETE